MNIIKMCSLVRTLSEHHWLIAERTLLQTRERSIKAGFAPCRGETWSYYVERPDMSLPRFERISFRNGTEACRETHVLSPEATLSPEDFRETPEEKVKN